MWLLQPFFFHQGMNFDAVSQVNGVESAIFWNDVNTTATDALAT